MAGEGIVTGAVGVAVTRAGSVARVGAGVRFVTWAGAGAFVARPGRCGIGPRVRSPVVRR